MLKSSPPRAWAEVSLDTIGRNLDILRQASGNAHMMPVIKAGAYGHGLEAVARYLDNKGVKYFGVANVGEARRLRQAGCRTRPYILGPCFPEEREEVVANGWRSFISTIEEANHYNSLAEQYGTVIDLHISVDVGMGRGGLLYDQLEHVACYASQWKNLNFEGVAAHLPGADENRRQTLDCLAAFERSATLLQSALKTINYVHVASSAGILDYHVPFANMVRPGLSLYGYSPVKSSQTAGLAPALTLKSRITVVRELPAGHGVSYGSIYVTDRPTKVATVGFGYADGYFRALSGKGAQLYYRGRFVPVLGRVTMDQIMVDVTGIDDVQPGDEIEIFGNHVPVPELARLAGTIPWEVLTSIGPRIPRIYV